MILYVFVFDISLSKIFSRSIHVAVNSSISFFLWLIFCLCVYIYTYTHTQIHTHVCMPSHFSHVGLFENPWTIGCQAPLSMKFCWQEYWSGLPCPSPEDLLDPGIEPESLMSPALVALLFTTRATWEAHTHTHTHTHTLSTSVSINLLLDT